MPEGRGKRGCVFECMYNMCVLWVCPVLLHPYRFSAALSDLPAAFEAGADT